MQRRQDPVLRSAWAEINQQRVELERQALDVARREAAFREAQAEAGRQREQQQLWEREVQDLRKRLCASERIVQEKASSPSELPSRADDGSRSRAASRLDENLRSPSAPSSTAKPAQYGNEDKGNMPLAQSPLAQSSREAIQAVRAELLRRMGEKDVQLSKQREDFAAHLDSERRRHSLELSQIGERQRSQSANSNARAGDLELELVELRKAKTAAEAKLRAVDGSRRGSELRAEQLADSVCTANRERDQAMLSVQGEMTDMEEQLQNAARGQFKDLLQEACAETWRAASEVGQEEQRTWLNCEDHLREELHESQAYGSRLEAELAAARRAAANAKAHAVAVAWRGRSTSPAPDDLTMKRGANLPKGVLGIKSRSPPRAQSGQRAKVAVSAQYAATSRVDAVSRGAPIEARQAADGWEAMSRSADAAMQRRLPAAAAVEFQDALARCSPPEHLLLGTDFATADRDRLQTGMLMCDGARHAEKPTASADEAKQGALERELREELVEQRDRAERRVEEAAAIVAADLSRRQERERELREELEEQRDRTMAAERRVEKAAATAAADLSHKQERKQEVLLSRNNHWEDVVARMEAECDEVAMSLKETEASLQRSQRAGKEESSAVARTEASLQGVVREKSNQRRRVTFLEDELADASEDRESLMAMTNQLSSDLRRAREANVRIDRHATPSSATGE